MADYPTTNLSSELISAGLNPNNPSGTYVDFATQLAKNAQEQAAQEQAIARAKELTAQSQIETQQEQDAQAAGYNKYTKGMMTPEQALAQLKVILSSKGLPTDGPDIENWYASLPALVDESVIDIFANKFMSERIHEGVPTPFTADHPFIIPKGKSAADIGLTDMEDAEGNSVDAKTVSDGTYRAYVPDAGMYSVVLDNRGQIEKVIPAGKEPTDNSAKQNAKAAGDQKKEIQKLNDVLDKIIATNRRAGIVNTITRAKQGLTALAQYIQNPTPVNLKAVEADVASIMTGGIATGEAMDDSSYKNMITDLDKSLSYWTGKTNIAARLFTHVAPIQEIIPKLKALMEDLLNTAMDTITKQIDSERTAFADIPDDQWNEIRNAKINTMTLSSDVTKALGSVAPAAASTSTPAPSGMPSADEIEAELAKRK